MVKLNSEFCSARLCRLMRHHMASVFMYSLCPVHHVMDAGSAGSVCICWACCALQLSACCFKYCIHRVCVQCANKRAVFKQVCCRLPQMSSGRADLQGRIAICLQLICLPASLRKMKAQKLEPWQYSLGSESHGSAVQAAMNEVNGPKVDSFRL